jgi:hypothetical protein
VPNERDTAQVERDDRGRVCMGREEKRVSRIRQWLPKRKQWMGEEYTPVPDKLDTAQLEKQKL